MRTQPAAIVAAVCLLAACASNTEPVHFGDVSEAATVCATGTVTAGLDVSSYQGTINWVTVKADTKNNIKWAYAKATEGITITDSEFGTTASPKNWANMKAAGILRGGYHFFHSSDNGTSQADAYLAAVKAAGGFATGDLPPMLDWETTDSGSTSAQAVSNAQLFINEIAAKTGMKTVIYTDFGFFNGLTGTSGFSSDQLWVANWFCTSDCTGLPSGSSCPNVDSPWSSWILWQWNDSASVAGISSNPDGDVFNGTLAQMQTWAGGMTATCPNGNGTYCGGDNNSLTTGTLYTCNAGSFTVDEVCSNGCDSTPPGGSDSCAAVTPTSTPIAQQSSNDSITVVNWTDKHVSLFASTSAGTIYETSTTTTGDAWSAPADVASGATCGSAAAFWGASWLYPEVFSPLSSGATDHLYWTSSGWSTFQSYGGTGLSHLTTTVGNDGRANVFALGSTGVIWENTWNTTSSAWRGWASLGGPTTGSKFVTGAGAITWGNGTLEIFATDASDMAWHAWYPNESNGTTWSAWTELGSGVATRPMPVRWSDGSAGHAEVFARGTNGLLMHSEYDYSLTAGYPPWSAVDSTTKIIGEPMAIMNETGGSEVFARNSKGKVLHATRSGTSYTSLTAIGRQVSGSDPFGWVRGDGTGEVFVITTTGELRHSHHAASGWTKWANIGSGFDTCAPAIAQTPEDEDESEE